MFFRTHYLIHHRCVGIDWFELRRRFKIITITNQLKQFIFTTSPSRPAYILLLSWGWLAYGTRITGKKLWDGGGGGGQRRQIRLISYGITRCRLVS